MVPTPDGVWNRDSQYWRKFEGGGTQHTDFNKGLIGRIFTKFLRRRNRGVQEDPDPPTPYSANSLAFFYVFLRFL